MILPNLSLSLKQLHVSGQGVVFKETVDLVLPL